LVKLFQRAQRSLFGEILDWMLTPLLLLVPVSIGVTWLVAQGIANAPFDRALESNIQTLARLIDTENGQIKFVLPQPAREILGGDDIDRVYYQLLDEHGTLLSGEREIPVPGTDDPPTPGVVYLSNGQMHGKAVRVASLWIAGGTPDAPLTLLQVAETREQSVLATGSSRVCCCRSSRSCRWRCC
jgi:two-component system sensor histidine kinase TctE